MLDAFYISASGMHGHQVQVDVISNNLANVNTTGFKKSDVNFEDMMYRQMDNARGPLSVSAGDNLVGIGTSVGSVGKVFTQGDIKSTEQPLDLAIQGKGFFEVLLPDGTYAYTRTGNFQIDRDGMIVDNNGNALNPAIQVPPDTESVLIQPDGLVMAQMASEQDPVELGMIELASFTNPAGLTPVGDNLYVPSHQSGDAFYLQAGRDNAGSILQGFVEGANVDMVEELTDLILAQRGYQMNAKLVQTADEMLGIINNLRR